MKKIIITGSNGLLGQKLVKLFLTKNNYKIYALSRGENRLQNKIGYTYYNIDITNEEELSGLVTKIRPHFIINTAAMTNVDACETQRKKCDLINVNTVALLADLCRKNSIHLIHISTDFIFDGQKKGYYTEKDKPNPLSYYGLSKLRSENIILSADINYTILRTVLVYGSVDSNDRSNIVLWVKKSLEDKKHINVVTDQFRMPTFVEDLAEACFLSIEKCATGIYNVSSNTLMSIYELALEIANTFNLDASYIHSVETSDLNLPAKRPFKTGFDLKKSITDLNLPSYSFTERLRVFKNQISMP